MASNILEETVASAKDLPPEQAIPMLRDVILGKNPNDAECIKAKERVPHLVPPLCVHSAELHFVADESLQTRLELPALPSFESPTRHHVSSHDQTVTAGCMLSL